MAKLYCPYCCSDNGEPEECYEEDVEYEYECDICGKEFIFFVRYTRYYNSHKLAIEVTAELKGDSDDNPN